jgi:hypothetical protein
MANTKSQEHNKPNNKEQSKLFIEAARKIGCDEDPAHFDEILKKVARHKPPVKQASASVTTLASPVSAVLASLLIATFWKPMTRRRMI